MSEWNGANAVSGEQYKLEFSHCFQFVNGVIRHNLGIRNLLKMLSKRRGR